MFFKASESWGFIPAASLIYGYMVVLALHGPRDSPAGPKPQLHTGFSQLSHSRVLGISSSRAWRPDPGRGPDQDCERGLVPAFDISVGWTKAAQLKPKIQPAATTSAPAQGYRRPDPAEAPRLKPKRRLLPISSSPIRSRSEVPMA